MAKSDKPSESRFNDKEPGKTNSIPLDPGGFLTEPADAVVLVALAISATCAKFTGASR